MEKRKPRPVGRPRLLDPKLTAKFCEHLKAGATEKGAAAACGIGYSTYFHWLEQSDEPDAPAELLEFRRAILEARGQARVLTEASVRKQHPLPWLYNRYPEDWKPIVPRTSDQEDDESISLSAARKILDEYLETDKGNGNGKH